MQVHVAVVLRSILQAVMLTICIEYVIEASPIVVCVIPKLAVVAYDKWISAASQRLYNVGKPRWW